MARNGSLVPTPGDSGGGSSLVQASTGAHTSTGTATPVPVADNDATIGGKARAASPGLDLGFATDELMGGDLKKNATHIPMQENANKNEQQGAAQASKELSPSSIVPRKKMAPSCIQSESGAAFLPTTQHLFKAASPPSADLRNGHTNDGRSDGNTNDDVLAACTSI